MRNFALNREGLMSMLLLTCFLFSSCQKDESPIAISSDEVQKTAYTSTSSGVKRIDVSKVAYNSGYAYHVRDWFGVGGDTEWSTTSTLRIFENGVALGPAHSSHNDVRAYGKGRFSHWGNDLYFTASDNTDPRTNGRTYTYTISDNTESSVSESDPSSSSIGKSIDMSRVTGTWGSAYHLRDWFGVGGDNEWAKNSTMKLFENGRELGPAHSSRNDVSSYGKGRFVHWGNDLYFSSSDNTDPRTNGRKYTYTTDGSTSSSAGYNNNNNSSGHYSSCRRRTTTCNI